MESHPRTHGISGIFFWQPSWIFSFSDNIIDYFVAGLWENCWKKFRMLEPESHPRLPQHPGKLSEISVFIGRSPVHCNDTVQKISKKKSNRFSWFVCIVEGISLGHTLLYKIGINTLISDPVHNNAPPIYFNLALDDFFHRLLPELWSADCKHCQRPTDPRVECFCF